MTTADTSLAVRVSPGLRRLFVAALIATVGLAAAWLLLTGKPKPEPSNVIEAPRPLISVIDAEPRAVKIPVRSQGTVEAVRRISLVAQVGGKVDSVSDGFVDGAFFETGDELLRIESADYDFAIARAESQVAAAEQRLAEERGRNRQAKREWRDLGSTEANALFLREPQMKAAKAALEAAKADLAAAKLALERSVIRAPFDGRIEAKRADIGQYLAPGVSDHRSAAPNRRPYQKRWDRGQSQSPDQRRHRANICYSHRPRRCHQSKCRQSVRPPLSMVQSEQGYAALIGRYRAAYLVLPRLV